MTEPAPSTQPTAPEPLQYCAADALDAPRVLADQRLARLLPWGIQDYATVLSLQFELHRARKADAIPDTWLAGEHPTVVTQGVRGAASDLILPTLPFPVFNVDRGGQTTIHNPGQLVLYPIVRTRPGMLAQARASRLLLCSVKAWLESEFNLALDAPKGRPGLYHAELKVAAIGLSIRGGVTMHGIAINCANDLAPWSMIIPCGEPATRPTTLTRLCGVGVTPQRLIHALPRLLTAFWRYETIEFSSHGETRSETAPNV